MERNTQKNGLINLLALVAVGAAALAVARYGQSFAGVTSVVFMGLGALVAAISWFQMRLEERERLEKLEFEELTRSAASSALFNAAETEVFPVRRSREQFERFFVPAFTVVLCAVEIGGAIVLGRSFQKALVPTLNQPVVSLGLFAMFGLLLFLLGKYSTSLARLQGLRLLRPGAAYLLFNAYLCGLVVLGILPVLGGFQKVDHYLGGAFIALLLLIGLETLINLVLELYRPRVKGKVERPMYESRLVSLLGQPEGLVRTAAQTLDYQFGFKVSETWAYRLFERWFPWMVLGQGAVLLLSTSIVFVEAGEQAVLEHNGKFAAVLSPGAHLKYPWPVDQIHRYPTDRIQTIDVGFTPDDDDRRAGQTVLWTVAHTKEENFLVADRETAPTETATNSAATRRPPPVSLLTVSIPVQFQITNLFDWLYNNQDPAVLLESIATREVVHYLVSVDFEEIMSRGRTDAARVLREKIQAKANDHKLGANILFVGLQDIHPPVSVAPEYEKVVAARHTAEADMLDALAYQTTTNALADAQAFKLVSEAQSDQMRQRVEGEARAALFTNQLPAYLASPSVYTNRAYWEMFTRATAGARKYILLATNTHDIVVLNLEDKISEQYLQGLTVPPPPSGAAPK